MKYKLYEVVFPDKSHIVMLFDNGWTLLHYLNDNLEIKGCRIYPLSFWESIKYVFGR